MNKEQQYSRPSANILLEAAELQERKGNDYNNATSSVSQADYYPRGVWSILDVVNAKYLRMVSVLETMEQGGKVNFESVEDSAIDLINYASFIAAYMRGDVPGQNPAMDIFNRPMSKQTHPTTALTPTKFREGRVIPPQKTFDNVVAQENVGKINAYLPTGRFEE
jgi:hypothetical protein